MSKRTNISEERKVSYYLGFIFIVFGLILFISTFFTHTSNINQIQNSDGFSTIYPVAPNNMIKAISGMILIFIGVILQNVGRKGLAGSGIILDTEQERKDLEPINRMMGGQLNDFLEETHLKNHFGSKEHTTIKVRCKNCKSLNDEKNNFCGECGKEL